MREHVFASLIMSLLDAFVLPWATRLVRWWVGLYTVGLPAQMADRRSLEIESDLHDHRAALVADGYAPRSIAIHLLYRWVRGIPSDLAWRFGDARELVLGHRAKINYSIVGAISAASDRRMYYQRSWWNVMGKEGLYDLQPTPRRARWDRAVAYGTARERGYVPTSWGKRKFRFHDRDF